MNIENALREVTEFMHADPKEFTDLDAYNDRKKEILELYWWTVRENVQEVASLKAMIAHLKDELEKMAEYKMAAHQLIGIPASVGVTEPVEGFGKKPQSIMPAVREMALKIEAASRNGDK